MGLWQLLWINAAVLVFSYGVLWAIAQRLKDVSFIDAWWPTGMAVLAWTSLTLAGAGGVHGWLLAVLCTLWAARLGGHLFRLSLIHISEPTRLLSISYAVFCLKKKN